MSSGESSAKPMQNHDCVHTVNSSTIVLGDILQKMKSEIITEVTSAVGELLRPIILNYDSLYNTVIDINQLMISFRTDVKQLNDVNCSILGKFDDSLAKLVDIERMVERRKSDLSVINSSISMICKKFDTFVHSDISSIKVNQNHDFSDQLNSRNANYANAVRHSNLESCSVAAPCKLNQVTSNQVTTGDQNSLRTVTTNNHYSKIFISRLHPDTVCDDIKKYLQNRVNFQFRVYKCRTHYDSYSSFCLSVSNKYESVLLNYN